MAPSILLVLARSCALLHPDLDVYKPSLVILECLYERVVKGGLVLLDDFGTVPGATRATEEFFTKHDVAVEKHSISHIPAYVRKK